MAGVSGRHNLQPSWDPGQTIAQLPLDELLSNGIEAALIEVEGVADCAVFGIPDEEFGESLIAVVEREPGATATAESVRRGLQGRLAKSNSGAGRSPLARDAPARYRSASFRFQELEPMARLSPIASAAAAPFASWEDGRLRRVE